jgi:hypothetical protein
MKSSGSRRVVVGEESGTGRVGVNGKQYSALLIIYLMVDRAY